ncbi:ABC transporter ATP-binding protein [Apibacter muscae]|uniref:ABC transporter ATP-binding protein n=1 Tax=Apibacter muscae TaxID=2509004 RepID=A0A563DKD8_9FLAO|nr:ABC transporter ATP-binding protein [Apibacter muscae]TWP25224.1 ABC transporter ATP-binding protein [Apibacter muscae]TWP30569.1 ABC transporter ATP-binding protein [Apibacter muscae]
MKNAIEINNLEFSYSDKPVLKKLNVSFIENKFSVLLGINGGGKSTLFKIIAGLLKGYRGEIKIFNKNMETISFKERAPLIGFLPQFHQFVFSFTVNEVLLTGRTAFSGFSVKDSDQEMAEEIMKDLSIYHLKDKPINQLSGGEQQITMIGRLLMQNPKILLLDEPTNHLDVYYQHHLMEKLKKYSTQGFTVVSIMHNPTLAFQYADHYYYLHDGHVHTAEDPSVPDLNLLEAVYNMSFVVINKNEKDFILPFGEKLD